ncbi:hypothetical protein NX059_012017 [Plenodomus lindquistii]|nr:hypothetical protein NX059_012017 [Plenodomus lindquistii]
MGYTVWDGLRRPLPSHRSDPETVLKQKNHSANISLSKATRDTRPPRYLIKCDVSNWRLIADKLLTSSGLEEKLKDMTITDEVPVNLITEADVGDEVVGQLLSPVLRTLATKHDIDLQKTREKPENDVKPDISIYDAAAGTDAVVAVFELKCRYYVKVNQLTSAIFDTEKDHDTKHGPKTSSLIPKSHSETQIKQVCAYGLKRKCKYVALSDWETLVLFKLEPDVPGSKTPFRRAEVTIVPKGEERLALLGFFEQALQVYFEGKNNAASK